MYRPSSFVVDDQSILHDFIRNNSFAAMVSAEGTALVATHLPLMLDKTRGANGTLVGHMAKANSQWKQADGQSVLCLFTGPHAYISPGWYQESQVVPTWNYVAVHASGTLKLETRPAELVKIVRQTVEVYEDTMPTPWDIDSVDPALVEKLAEGIVGFSIEIRQLEGQWKLSQNHSIERRNRVVEGLKQRNMNDDVALANLMESAIKD